MPTVTSISILLALLLPVLLAHASGWSEAARPEYRSRAVQA